MNKQSQYHNSINIALVIPNIFFDGGIERLGCEIANWLSDKKQKILLLSHSPPTKEAQPISPLRKEIKHRFFSIENPNAVTELFVQNSIDCCVIFYSYPEAFGWIKILANSKIPLLYSEHSNPSLIETIRWNRFERQALVAASDRVHLLLDEYRASLFEEYQSKTRVVPNPVRYPITRVERSDRRSYLLLSLGRFNLDAKQLHLLIESFALLESQFPNWNLEIWGDGPDRERLIGLVSEKGLENRVLFCGNTAEANRQYQRCDLFCIPSKFEGFPLVVAEAMAHGLPVVGFVDCSGVNTIVQHGVNGLLAPEMSAESLAGELSKLMGDHELRNQMSEEAYRRAADFDKEKIMLQWEEMILECAQAKGATALDAVLKKPLSFESSAIDRYLLQKAARPFSKRDDSRFDSLLQYVDRNRNSLRVKLPWKLVLSLLRLKQRTALYLKKGAIK